MSLEVVESSTLPSDRKPAGDGWAVLLSTLDEVRRFGDAPLGHDGVRAVIAELIPSQIVTTLSSEGIACFSTDAAAIAGAKGNKTVALPGPARWAEGVAASFSGNPKAPAGARAQLAFLARGAEVAWATAGGLKPPPSARK